MKITITIEDSTPWYAPFSSQEAWLEHQRNKRERERRESVIDEQILEESRKWMDAIRRERDKIRNQ